MLHSTTRDVAGCNYGQRMPPYLRPATDFMESFQQDVTPSMRGILIDWLVEVGVSVCSRPFPFSMVMCQVVMWA